jgi:protein gp37
MTGIQWTGDVWNPTTGCDRISEGCDNCYALKMAKRLKGMGQAKYQRDGDPRTSGPGFGLSVHPDALDLPLGWRKPRVIFVNSMSDLFHARVPDAFIASVFTVMAATPRHTYQVLTKRPRRMRALLASPGFHVACLAAAAVRGLDLEGTPWPLPNVWLGTSIESARYSWRANALREVPAAVRFISAEPLLGSLAGLDLGGIGWLIIGGESGPGARPMDEEWARTLAIQATRAQVPVFMKQMGSVLGKQLGAGAKGGDMEHWPEDLRIRDFPRVTEMTGAA